MSREMNNNHQITKSPNHQIPQSLNRSRSAAILAGGKSRRFGSNKALAAWLDCRVIDAVVQAAKVACRDVVIITDEPEPYLYLGLPVYPDIKPGTGPLNGLHSALHHTNAERILLLGCDMPLLSPKLLNRMWEIPNWAPVIIPSTAKGLEPLHAIYHKSLLPILDYRINSGRLSLRSLVKDLPYHTVTSADILEICPTLECLCSANTPEELARLKRHYSPT